MFRLTPLLLALALAPACDAPQQTADAIHEELKSHERTAWEDAMEVRLQELGAKIADTELTLSESDEPVPLELVDRIDGLDADYEKLMNQWDEVEQATSPKAWSLLAEALRRDVDDTEARANELRQELQWALSS